MLTEHYYLGPTDLFDKEYITTEEYKRLYDDAEDVIEIEIETEE